MLKLCDSGNSFLGSISGYCLSNDWSSRSSPEKCLVGEHKSGPERVVQIEPSLS